MNEYTIYQADERLRSRLGSYVELDFTEITCEKVGLIGRSELLSAPLGGYTLGAVFLRFTRDSRVLRIAGGSATGGVIGQAS